MTFTESIGNKKIKNISQSISKELTDIYNWLIANKLSLNLGKTKFMLFHNPQKNIDDFQLNLVINNFEIENITSFDFLGTVISSTLSWKSHISKISKKISRTLGVMNKMKHFLPSHILRIFHDSLISPHLNFGILSWGFECQRLQKLQKKAVRIITSSKFNAHSEPLFKRLNIIKIEHIFHLKCLNFYYKFIKGSIPEYFQSMFTKNESIHSYGTRQKSLLHRTKTKTSSARQCIRHHIPKLINEVPSCISDKLHSHSYHGFSNYIT